MKRFNHTYITLLTFLAIASSGCGMSGDRHYKAINYSIDWVLETSEGTQNLSSVLAYNTGRLEKDQNFKLDSVPSTIDGNVKEAVVSHNNQTYKIDISSLEIEELSKALNQASSIVKLGSSALIEGQTFSTRISVIVKNSSGEDLESLQLPAQITVVTIRNQTQIPEEMDHEYPPEISSKEAPFVAEIKIESEWDTLGLIQLTGNLRIGGANGTELFDPS